MNYECLAVRAPLVTDQINLDTNHFFFSEYTVTNLLTHLANPTATVIIIQV